MYKSLIGATCACLAVVSFSADATIINVTVIGDGVLVDGKTRTDVGSSSIGFSYDTSLFTLTEDIVFSGGTGKRFTTSDNALTVIGGGINYTVTRMMNGISIFDQPNSNDQLNFEYNGNTFIQWNDSSSSSFTDPLPTSFDAISDLIIDQNNNNPNLLLNGSLVFTGLNGSSNLSLRITNATASFSTVPIPAAVWLFGSGLLGLVGVARRKKA